MSKNLELAKAIRHGLFADRPTVKDAFDYAFDIIDSMRGANKVAATTALYVVLNTLSNEIEKNEKEAA
jgi:hypothetical protein